MRNLEPRQRFRAILEHLHPGMIDPVVGRRAFSRSALSIMRTCARVVAEAREDGMYCQRLRELGLTTEHGPDSNRPLCLSTESLAFYHHPPRSSQKVFRDLEARGIIGRLPDGRRFWDLDRLEREALPSDMPDERKSPKENLETRQRFRAILKYLHADTIDPLVGRRAFSRRALSIMRASARMIAEAQEDGEYCRHIREMGLLADHGPDSNRPLCLFPQPIVYHRPPREKWRPQDLARAGQPPARGRHHRPGKKWRATISDLEARGIIGRLPQGHWFWDLDRLECVAVRCGMPGKPEAPDATPWREETATA
jgi:hypothetical protein